MSSENAYRGRSAKAAVHLRFENRLPITLKQISGDRLEEGAWINSPPPQIGAHSVSLFTAEPSGFSGFIGRSGVKSVVLYQLQWEGRTSTLTFSIEKPGFANRRITCEEGGSVFEEGADNWFQIQTSWHLLYDGYPNVAIITIDFRSVIAKHIILEEDKSALADGATATLREGKLSLALKQSGRSALVRVVNLTRYDLKIVDARGITRERGWIRAPAERIAAMSLHDLGVIRQGSGYAGVQGEIKYVLEAPKGSDEARVLLRASWQSPWAGRRNMEVEDVAETPLFVIQATSDKNPNLVGTVHVINLRQLPVLEVLSAIALSPQGSGAAKHGLDVTEHVTKHMTSAHELRLPSVRELVRQAAAEASRSQPQHARKSRARPAAPSGASVVPPSPRQHLLSVGAESVANGFDKNKSLLSVASPRDWGTTTTSDWNVNVSDPSAATTSPTDFANHMLRTDFASELDVLYRIGPEVFRHIFSAHESVNISSAVPGGTGLEGTILAAMEAVEGEDSEGALNATIGTSDRALLCQKLLTSALSPVVQSALAASDLGPGWAQTAEARKIDLEAHLWPCEGQTAELDAEGLLEVLRALGDRISAAAKPGALEASAFARLVPLERLVSRWAEQADLDDAIVSDAAEAAGVLLEAFNLDDVAVRVRELKTSERPRHRRNRLLKKGRSQENMEASIRGTALLEAARSEVEDGVTQRKSSADGSSSPRRSGAMQQPLLLSEVQSAAVAQPLPSEKVEPRKSVRFGLDTG